MIFVTVGSSRSPFDRLLQAVDAASFDEDLVVQHGPSTVRPRNAECVDFLDFDGFVAQIARARVVVTHAGVGSIMTSLAHGKQPIVVPRRARFGEAVDDHQLPFARRAGELGLVHALELEQHLAHAVRALGGARTIDPVTRSPIEVELRQYIEETTGRKPPMRVEEARIVAWL
jgi:UDP-N-acetylglucosamine transferase subunit ALG13